MSLWTDRNRNAVTVPGVAIATFDRARRSAWQNDLYRSYFAQRTIDEAAMGEALRHNRVVRSYDSDLPNALIVYASAERAALWHLPDDALGEIRSAACSAVALGVPSPDALPALELACAACNLTDLQTRVVVALIRCGTVPDAARSCGVTYNTARDAISDALKRSGMDRAATLIQVIVLMSFGIPSEGGDAAIADMFGLTKRQLLLAMLVAEGMARESAANVAGVSPAVAKKELARVYVEMGVSSATELSRLFGQARAVATLEQLADGDIPSSADIAEPRAEATRTDGRRVTWSDYGPSSGKPVLVLHSSITTRPIASALRAALQAGGFRPISVDRPGYGGTDPAPPGLDQWTAGADDMAWLTGQLGLKRIDLVARGAAQVAHAALRSHPDLYGRAVLVNPDPDGSASRRFRGPMGAIKRRYLQDPSIIALNCQLLSKLATRERSRFIMTQSIKGSGPDEAVMADPVNFLDYYRSVRALRLGRLDGMVAEQIAIAAGGRPSAVSHADKVTILIGETDFLHDPHETADYWKRVFPAADIRIVAGAGRFLAIGNPAEVVTALSR